MELELIAYFCLSYALGILGIWFLRHKITMWIAQNTWEYMLMQLKKEENMKALSENIGILVLDPLKQKIFGALGGFGKGISGDMKRAENDLISAGIDQVAGLEGIGDMAMEYLKKYPSLRAILPVLMAQMGKGQGQKSGLP